MRTVGAYQSGRRALSDEDSILLCLAIVTCRCTTGLNERIERLVLLLQIDRREGSVL